MQPTVNNVFSNLGLICRSLQQQFRQSFTINNEIISLILLNQIFLLHIHTHYTCLFVLNAHFVGKRDVDFFHDPGEEPVVYSFS